MEATAELPTVDVETERKQSSLEIINSILHKGLLSASGQVELGLESFSSNDTTFPEDNIVSGRRVGAGSNLAEDFYKNYFSIFPVIAERQLEASEAARNLPEATLEERFKSSLLAVVPYSRLEDQQIRKGTDTATKFGEARLNGPVLPGKISMILVPAHLYGEIQGKIQPANVKIIPVGDTEKLIFGKLCKVPDYESKIALLTALGKKDVTDFSEDLFLHGVRLPTAEDVKGSLKKAKK